jgi:uncharacterized membrane protein (DUF485 family)
MEHRHLTPSDWDALANDPDFLALLRARRRFIVPAVAFFLAFYLALPVGVIFAPAWMNRPVLGPMTFAFAFGLCQFAMAWVLLAFYMVEAKKFDARAQELVVRAAAALKQ